MSDVAAIEVLRVEALTKHFDRGGGLLSPKLPPIRAVNGVDLAVRAGETLGIVGESGCGKSTLGLLMLRLIEPTSGRIVFEGQDLTAINRGAMRPIRRRLQIIFQDPFSSLDPRMSIRQTLSEPLQIHRVGDKSVRRHRVEQIMQLVGLRREMIDRYPHELSGGQRQRVAIARALILQPRLIVADEAVSALDVSIQAQILNLLADLKQELGLSLIFISHNIAVIQHLCTRIAVMYLGRIVEVGPADDVVMEPLHPYTRALIDSVPGTEHDRPGRGVLPGEIPSQANPPSGCHFHPRCPMKRALCAIAMPPLRSLAGRMVACHFAEDIPNDLPDLPEMPPAASP